MSSCECKKGGGVVAFWSKNSGAKNRRFLPVLADIRRVSSVLVLSAKVGSVFFVQKSDPPPAKRRVLFQRFRDLGSFSVPSIRWRDVFQLFLAQNWWILFSNGAQCSCVSFKKLMEL